MSNPLPDTEGIDRLRGVKREKRETPIEPRATPQATFLPPPAPLQPSAFDQYTNNGTYTRANSSLLPAPPGSMMANSRPGTINPTTYGGLLPNSRYSHTAGYHGLSHMQGYGNGNFQPQHSFASSSQYPQQVASLNGTSGPSTHQARVAPQYHTGSLYQPYAPQPSSLRYPVSSSNLTTYPGVNPNEPLSHNAAPALVVNEAYIDHLRQRFPLVTAHRKEIESLTRLFPQIDHDYYLYDKIGEGTFSSVYKGVDVKHDLYDNTGWDLYPSGSDSEGDGEGQPPPPALVWESEDAGGASSRGVMSSDPSALPRPTPFSAQRRGARYKLVAVKKIYVTSSCQRIENEIEILHTLSGHPNIVGLITALRREDQIIVVTPYYRHHDFRETFQAFSYDDMRHYMRCLIKGLSFCHMHHIIHRDVKPSNFLYHLTRRRGQLADFGLAQRQELPSRSSKRIRPIDTSHNDDAGPNQTDPPARPALSGVPYSYVDDNGVPGVLRNETRPSIRANRAGTRGFRAPEVLLKVVNQTTSIDIWSAGVILLCMLSRRFPFFNSTSDQDALIEIGIIFGSNRMQEVARSFDRTFLTNVPSVTAQGMTFEELLEFTNPEEFPDLPYQGIDLLKRLLEPQPDQRITADQALHHPFLSD